MFTSRTDGERKIDRSIVLLYDLRFTDMNRPLVGASRTCIKKCGKKYAFGSEERAPLVTSWVPATDDSLSFSGSNQARKGRLVNALAVRGDERRDTLR